MAHCTDAASANLSRENEDEVHIVLPSSKYKDLQNPPRIPHGIVISGEASESDEEIDTHQVVNVHQSASDFSISDVWAHGNTEGPEKESSKENAVRYNTLLHKKQREKNQTLRKDIVELVTQPYESATKEIHNISQQLIKSQLLVQELRSTIRRLTNDLFDMEDKMEALRTGSFLPDVSDTPTSEISE